MRYKLPRTARLRKASDFRRMQGRGRRLTVFPLRVAAVRRPDKPGGGVAWGDLAEAAPGAPDGDLTLAVRRMPSDPYGRPAGPSRLGLAVSRKLGGAVVRNRWKRAIREAFRLNAHRLGAAWDLAVSVAWDARPEDVARVPGALVQVIDLLAGQQGGAP